MASLVSARGLDAALVLPNAESATLCVYDGDREIHRAPMTRDADGVLRGLAPGFSAGARYGFRVQGPYDPKRGFRFDPSKLLADPYAWRFDRPFELHSSMFKFGEETGPHTPKAIAGEPAAGEPGHKRIAPDALVIYELNLRGFSRLNPAIPEAARGTFAGARSSSVDRTSGKRSASPRSRSCPRTRSSTTGICLRSGCRTLGVTIPSCLDRPIRVWRPAVGPTSGQRPMRCM